MNAERHYPAEEDTHADVNIIRLEEVLSSFEGKLDRNIRGEVLSSVLFEGDFDLSGDKMNKGYPILLGYGYRIDQATLFTRFIREMGRKGTIISSEHQSEWSEIEGGTDSAVVLKKSRYPLPVDRVKYTLKPHKGGFNVVVIKDRFFEDVKRQRPLLERWYTNVGIKETQQKPVIGYQQLLPARTHS